MDPYNPNDQTRPVDGMGCVAKGCLTLAAVGIALVLIAGFIGWQAIRTFRGYVSDHPADVQVYPATDAQYQAVLQKLAPFSAAMDANRRATLELTGNDLNILVARDPSFKHLRGRAAFRIAHDEITGDLSVPLNTSQPGASASHYWFNGQVVMGLIVNDGEIEILPHSVEVNGKPLPSWLVQLVQNKDFIAKFNENFSEGFKREPKAREMMRKIQSARVDGDRLILTSAGDEPAVAPSPPSP